MGRFQSFKDHSASGTLIEQRDGKNWSIIPIPNATTQGDSLAAVAAVSGSDVRGVGAAGGRTRAEHWDGAARSIVPSPDAASAGNVLNGIAAVSANDVRAVGSSYDGLTRSTLVEYWDGAAWSIVPSPDASTGDNCSPPQRPSRRATSERWAPSSPPVATMRP